MTTPSTTATTKSLRSSVGFIAGQREAVVAEGPDALDFLQGQLSQDIAALAPGEASFSLLLHPQGKVSAWFRITRVADDRFIIDVDAGWSDEVLTRLNRFKLRTKIDIEAAPWSALTLVGPGADDVTVDGVEHDMLTSWAGVPVRDVFGSEISASSITGTGGATKIDEIDEIDPSVFTALRVEGGIPRMGVELDESTIPAAAGVVEQSVSFTKGCYTGQELVARIDSRGNNVPKRLVGLVLDGSETPGSDTPIASDGSDVGVVTSSAWSEQLEAAVCLGYVSRAVDIGQQVTLTTATGSVSGEVRALPLVRAGA